MRSLEIPSAPVVSVVSLASANRNVAQSRARLRLGRRFSLRTPDGTRQILPVTASRPAIRRLICAERAFADRGDPARHWRWLLCRWRLRGSLFHEQGCDQRTSRRYRLCPSRIIPANSKRTRCCEEILVEPDCNVARLGRLGRCSRCRGAGRVRCTKKQWLCDKPARMDRWKYLFRITRKSQRQFGKL